MSSVKHAFAAIGNDLPSYLATLLLSEQLKSQFAGLSESS
jgi:hypothetical protein